MAASLIAGGLGLVGSLVAGSMGKDGAEASAESSERAAKYAADIQNKQYEQTREDFAPWRYVGANALNWMSRGLTGEAIPGQMPTVGGTPAPATAAPATTAPATQQQPMIWQPGQMTGTGDGGYQEPGQWVPNPAYSATPATPATTPVANQFADSGSVTGNRNAFMDMFKTSPDYQFRMSEGTKALDRSAAARGMVRSGAQQKAVTEYGQNLASGEYGNFYNRLASLAGIGQSATGSTASAGSAAAANSGNAILQGGMAAGQARASGYNAMASGVGSGVNNAMFGILQAGQRGGFGGGYSYPGMYSTGGTGTGGLY